MLGIVQLMRSKWARNELRRLFDFEHDVLDLAVIREVAEELGLDVPTHLYIETSPTPVRRSRAASGFVYLIRSAVGLYKIGSTSCAQKRLSTLRTGSPVTLDLVLSIPTRDKTALERLIHRRFASKRQTGEWFALNAMDVKWIQGLAQVEL